MKRNMQDWIYMLEAFGSPSNQPFFDVWVCHPNAESYNDLKPQEIYRLHENEEEHQYSSSA